MEITTPRRGIWGRMFGRQALDERCVQEGREAARNEAELKAPAQNRYEKGTIEYKSWKKGYDSADTSGYVW